jgi:hypothetical protein
MLMMKLGNQQVDARAMLVAAVDVAESLRDLLIDVPPLEII